MSINKKELLFYITFSLAIIARAMVWHTITIPYTIIYYSFIILWFGMIFSEKISFNVFNKKSILILLSLLLYFLFFGLFNIKDLDFDDTISVLIRSISMLLFIFISVYWISRFDEGIKKTVFSFYISMSLLLITCFLFNIKEIDLFQTLSAFWSRESSIRYRVLFGFKSPNIAAEYALSLIIVSFYILKKLKTSYYLIFKKGLIWVLNIIFILMILANNSRGTTVAMIFIFAILISSKILGIRRSKTMFRYALMSLLSIILLLVLYAEYKQIGLYEIFEVGNRSIALLNAKATINSGHSLFGFGRISGEYFQQEHILYGYKISYMEMFYIGVFVTSGIIGCIWISLLIVFLAYSLKNINTNDLYLKKWIIICFLYVVIISFFEEYMFSYTYVTSTFFLLMFILSINEKKCQKNEELDFNQEFDSNIIQKEAPRCI